MEFTVEYLWWKLFDEQKQPLVFREPWLNGKAKNYLNSIVKTNKAVLEFGAGGSTLYFSDTCAYVDSVEHDKEWVKKVEPYVYKNNVHFYPYGKFPKKRVYDIILIDGKYRLGCFKYARKLIKPGGIIVFDNYDRYSKELLVPTKIFTGYANDGAGKTTTAVYQC